MGQGLQDAGNPSGAFVLETLHELIYGMRFIVLIVALLGIGYALVLFYRAFEVYNTEKTQKS